MATTTNNASTANSQANTLAYAINQSLLNLNTTIPAIILAINDDGTFDIKPLLNIINASGVPSAPPNIYSVPASIVQGGTAGIIISYQINDTVLVSCSQRDISAIKKTWTQGNPASYRKFNLADAIIIGQLNNTSPTIYVKIDTSGITITAPSLPVIINANEVDINAGTIKLGQTGLNPILIENVALNFTSPSLQSGTGTSGTITFTSGGSSIVQAGA